MNATTLRVLADTLLPGVANAWPSASAAGVDVALAADAATHEPLRVALDDIRAALGPDAARLDDAARVALLSQIELDAPEAFGTLVAACYLAYYTSPMVLGLLAETGYEAGPPQPCGHHLPPFDERMLEIQKRRTPFWRKADM